MSNSEQQKGDWSHTMHLCQWTRNGFLALGSLAIAACTNNYRPTALKIQSTVFTTPTATSTGSSGVFTISNVIRDTFNPSSVVDIIGDGSGALGSFCGSSSSSSGTSAASCNCTFYYTYSGATQQVDSPITYTEADLARCTYSSSIPSAVTTGVTVAIHVLSSDTYSNVLPFSFSGVGVTLDTSQANSFLSVIRYQCRDAVVIKGLLDQNVYDPFQSENPHLTYPLDFYSTNIAYTMATYASKSSKPSTSTYGWNCPTIFTPDKYLNANALASFNASYHFNMTLYSKAALSNSKLIYPPSAGVFDRSTFYVAKKATGVFNVPLNAVLAPGPAAAPLVTGTSGLSDPIGYAAAPVVTSNGTESCPDSSVTIPSGFHWVKVWLFRASLAQRNYSTYGPAAQGLSLLQWIACNQGDWQNNGGPIFNGCSAAKYDTSFSSSGTGYSLSQYSGKWNGDLDTTHRLADRVLGTMMCVKLDSGPGSNACSNGAAGSACKGGDAWITAVPYVNPSASPPPTIPTFPDPMGVGGNSSGPARLPFTTDIGSTSLDASVGITSRYDFLFVVSPVTLMSSDMENSSTASLAYQPFRYYSNTDCLSDDPSNPTFPGDCAASNAISTYGLKLHDVSTNGDPPADDPNRPGVFPMCALQPN